MTTVHGGGGNDVISGTEFADRLFGNAGADIIKGFGGNDFIQGGTFNDDIDGGDGDDTIVGFLGNDSLTGGQGHDTFVFGQVSGTDVITDFDAGEDMIQIKKGVNGIKTAADVLSHAQQVGGDVVIDLGKGSKITLKNVSLDDLKDQPNHHFDIN